MIEWLLRSALVLSLCFALTLLLRKARPAHRHLIWLSGVIASALLATAPWWPRTNAGYAFDALVVGAGEAAAPVQHQTVWLPYLYLAVAAALIARLVVAHSRVMLLVRRAKPWTGELLLAREGPFTAGLFKQRIVLPLDAPDWTAARLAMVLAHERSHVRRFDNLTQLFAELHAAVAWINPLAWIAAKQMAFERELAADEAVLATNQVSSYAQLLVDHPHAPALAGAAAMASPSVLARRIETMLRAQRPLPRWLAACAVIAVVLGTAATGCQAEGSLDPDLIRSEIQSHRDAVKACYEAELAKRPHFDASTVMHFTISADGVPYDVSSEGAPQLDACFVTAFTNMRFPKPKGGGVVIVNYPLRFQTAPDEEKSSLDRDDVLSVVRLHIPTVQRCLSPGPVKIITKWVIHPSGEVTDAQTDAAPSEQACVLGVLRSMRFRSFTDGTVPVTFPMSRP